MLSVNAVSKRFANGTLALENISAEIETGRFRRPARALGLRQIDAAAAAGGAGDAERGRDRLG